LKLTDQLSETWQKKVDALMDKIGEFETINGCHWKCYLTNYSDLKDWLGNDYEAAKKHYIDHGKAEGRDCTCHQQLMDKVEADKPHEFHSFKEYSSHCLSKDVHQCGDCNTSQLFNKQW
jgi:hypothetical protein